jgi:hydroxypyruvate reductase
MQLTVSHRKIDFRDRKFYSIAVGKAARPMAIALDEILGDRIAGAVLAGPRNRPGTTREVGSHWQIFAGGHTVPNEGSVLAAKAAMRLLDQANAEQAPVIFLISGGGSAMFEAPISENISLADLQTANQVLVNSGAAISEINSVRRAVSAVKGGRLAARAPQSDQFTLVISDVPRGEDEMVASGPTVTRPSTALPAREVVAKYKLDADLPGSILKAIENEEAGEVVSDCPREYILLLDNSDALSAAAKAAESRGIVAEIAWDILDQPIAEGCEQLLAQLRRLRSRHPSQPVCLISGGEFSCPVRGAGLGGRNLETALRLAKLAKTSDLGQFVAFCAGTDGIDGNSPAAGALIDQTTVQRAEAIGLRLDDFLARSDSYPFFVALGDVFTTGPTETNVRDIRLLFSAPA